MKTRLWMTAILFTLAWPAFAAGPAVLDVTAADLTAAGVQDATPVAAAPDRFALPVHYFRSAEKLPAAEASHDCADCADLIAVYAAQVPDAPNWAANPQEQFLKIGGRLQVRAYIPSKKRVVTVTAASEATARKVSSYLVAKFSN